MNFDALIGEAKVRPLTVKDISDYCASTGVPIGEALDRCALELARAYEAGGIDFETGDAIANAIFASASRGDGCVIPALMFSIFLAFDAGEFYPDEIRGPSPEERFTRPQIRKILAAYSSG